jgi:hypothetical protein
MCSEQLRALGFSQSEVSTYRNGSQRVSKNVELAAQASTVLFVYQILSHTLYNFAQLSRVLRETMLLTC